MRRSYMPNTHCCVRHVLSLSFICLSSDAGTVPRKTAVIIGTGYGAAVTARSLP